MLFARVETETDAGVADGHAAELLVPKWFAKDPNTTHDADRADLVGAARAAFAFARERGSASVFEHWRAAQAALVDAPCASGPAPLVRMFGVALVERALIDAVCRAAGVPFAEALGGDLLGHSGLGAFEPGLEGWTPARLEGGRASVRLRHTVGLADALDASDLDPSDLDRTDDHPLTLEEDVARYGLTAFKVKVAGDAERDLARLERIAALLPEGALVTLDGNEQYEDAHALADTLDALEARGTAQRLVDGLASIEQPLPRARTHAADTRDGVARLAERAPLLIDEADARTDDYPRAVALGYAGVSVKACKGVSRAVLNAARIDARGAGLQSAEDLTNLPTLPLLQDLALVSALGLEHVERNGHHYFRGAAHLDAAERAHLVAAHADLFDEGALLRVERGELSLASVRAAGGFGYDGPVSDVGALAAGAGVEEASS